MVVINKATCVGCGKCAADCVAMNLSVKSGKAELTGECLQCGHCVAVCPANSVSIPEYDMGEVQDVGHNCGLTIDTLLQGIKARRSIRYYLTNKIERDKLENIIQAGRYTASGANRQACKFIVVQDQMERLKQFVWRGVEKAVANGLEDAGPLKRLVDLRNEKGIDYLFRNAPAILYIAAESIWDAGLAAQNIELALVAQGLGALYNGFLVRSTMFSEEAKALLQLDGKPLAVCMLLGYPDVEYARTAPRKKADVIWL